MADGELAGVVIRAKDVEIDRSENGTLGRGGYGVVYRGKYDGKVVAVKMMISEGGLDKKKKQLLMREARRLQQACKHENIINLLGVIMEMNNYSLVLEYMEYGTSIDFVKDYDVGVPLRVRFVQQVASAMAWLHSLDPPVKHLDLKAENVLINKDINAKVSDFGLSKWHSVTTGVSTQPVETKKRCGTYSHIPPEVFRDIHKKGSTEEDVFAFAVTVWEIFSGKEPYDTNNVDEIRQAVLYNQRPNMMLLVNQCPPKMKEIIQLSWDASPMRRPTFQAIKRELDKLYNKYPRKAIEDSLAHIQSQINSADNHLHGMSVPNSEMERMVVNGQMNDIAEEDVGADVAAAQHPGEHDDRETECLDSKLRQDGLESGAEQAQLENNLGAMTVNCSTEQNEHNQNNCTPEGTQRNDNLGAPMLDSRDTNQRNNNDHSALFEAEQQAEDMGGASASQRQAGLSGFVSLRGQKYIRGDEIQHPKGVIAHPESEEMLSVRVANNHPEVRLSPPAPINQSETAQEPCLPEGRNTIQVPGSQHNLGFPAFPTPSDISEAAPELGLPASGNAVQEPGSQQSSSQNHLSLENHAEESSSTIQSALRQAPPATLKTTAESPANAADEFQRPRDSSGTTESAAGAPPGVSLQLTRQQNTESGNKGTDYQTQQSHDAPPPTPQTQAPLERQTYPETGMETVRPAELIQPLTATQEPSQQSKSRPGKHRPLTTLGATLDQFTGASPRTGHNGHSQLTAPSQQTVQSRAQSTSANQHVVNRSQQTTATGVTQPAPPQRLFPVPEQATGVSVLTGQPQSVGTTTTLPSVLTGQQPSVGTTTTLPNSSFESSSQFMSASSGKMEDEKKRNEEEKRPFGRAQGTQSTASVDEGARASPITISHKHAGGGFTTITVDPNSKFPPNFQVGNNNVMYVGGNGGEKKTKNRKKPKKCKKSELTASEAQLTMDNIDLVAVEIGKDWKNLCRELDMSEADIEHLQFDYHISGLYEIMYQGIQRWMQRNGRAATVRKLAEALWEIDRDDIARRLQ